MCFKSAVLYRAQAAEKGASAAQRQADGEGSGCQNNVKHAIDQNLRSLRTTEGERAAILTNCLEGPQREAEGIGRLHRDCHSYFVNGDGAGRDRYHRAPALYEAR